jgi:hypothetical protein
MPLRMSEKQAGLELNWTCILLVYADDVNLFGDTTDAIEKNTETVIDVSKKVGLKVNVEKMKYMLPSRHQNSEHNYDIK